MKVYIGPYPEEGEQVVEVQIDDYDVWSMDITLAKIIEPMLVKLALAKRGAPYVNVEDCPPSLNPTNDNVDVNGNWLGGIDDTHHARWTWVLDEMIWAFHQKNYDWEEQYYSGESDVYFEDAEEEGYKVMKRGPNDTFRVDRAAMKVHQERMNNGFRLFGKYYENLWD
jgi:hypothetical protein